jgi:heme o synthase
LLGKEGFVIEEIELTREPVTAPLAPVAARVRIAAYVELTKPRITVLVMLTTAAGYFLGAGRTLNYVGLLHTLVGTGLLSSGIAALNQFMERELDARMRRTMMRPLPMRRLTARGAFLFGASLTLAAELYLLILVNPISALLGLSVIVGYLGCYTPLKTRTSLSTLVGAFPGAVPPLLGWAAATGHVSAEGLVLFAILFLWQFPHFFAIAWMYREDYARAGILMLPVIETDGRLTKQQIVVWTLLLVPVSLAPAALGLSGAIYFVGALILGALFLLTCVAAFLTLSRRSARRVLLASVLYLPFLFGLMVINQ